MERRSDTERAAERVEELLDQVRAGADPETTGRVEELVRVLLDLYGAALGRIVDLAGPSALAAIAGDPLVSSLLVLHDLHPDPAEVRIERALEGVRPHLGTHAGGVELVGVDDDGTVRLRLEGTCHRCPSSAETVRGALEDAVLGAAPEAAAVIVDGMVEAGSVAFVPLSAVGRRCPTGLGR